MSRHLVRAAGLAIALGLAAAGVTPGNAATPAATTSPSTIASWEQWQKVPGIFDIGGPRSDGRLVVAANGQLSLMAADGTLQPFARGSGGYQIDFSGTPEAYMTVSPGKRDDADGCDFKPDDVFVLDTGKPPGVIKVDASGTKSRLADIPAEGVNAITFDTTGTFGNRLIVTGPRQGKTGVYTVGCGGQVKAVNDSAPTLEGGIAVAPKGFGLFGGNLVAPDELTGKLYAIDAGGMVRTIATSTLPVGGDIGAESLGFIPDGFHARGGFVYVADRLTTGNPHPGNDALLRLNASELERFNLADGDLLVATEGGNFLELVHCADGCTIRQIAGGVPTAHGEGHVVAVVNSSGRGTAGNGAHAPSGGSGSSSPNLAIIAVAVGVVLLLIAGVVILVIRSRREKNYLGPGAGV
ncbi:MAG: hypothetical protein M3O87_03450 [Candidatus Dormibacteraeota bacterium]|nr:hypothetical protein [Candidatus Dormibacteraeota bacterium]